MQNDSDLRLNFIPITFDNETFTGYSLPYKDDEHLRDLRKLYRETHVFRREGDFIQCAPLTKTAEVLGKETTFGITKDFVFAEYLAREALIRFFQEKHARFASIYLPTTIILEKENLLKGAVIVMLIGFIGSGLAIVLLAFNYDTSSLIPWQL